MKNKELYEAALRLLAENPDTGETDDYEERAPYLLAAFCSEAQEVDTALRHAAGDSPLPEFNPVWIPLEGNFPLSAKLTKAACFYLAAMLVIDERPDLSDRLYDQYCSAMASLSSAFPAVTESISDCYFS